MTPARLPIPEWSQDMTPSHPTGRKDWCRGFTLIELLIVIMMIATLTAIGIPVYANALNNAQVTKAIADIHIFQKEIAFYHLFNGRVPDTLAAIGRANWRDPYGNPYEYLNIPNKGVGKARKDQMLVPLNSDYDLYSKGRDGLSKLPLTPPQSHDDIVRAADGGFVGLASEF